jgi:hypothetical protein
MKPLSFILNSAGLGVSSFCFMHCVIVILAFLGLLELNFIIFEIFENPLNHALLIITGITLAALSLIKFSKTIGTSRALGMNAILSIPFILGSGLLGLSFVLDGIYSEVLVVFGALALLSMHAMKLFKYK